MNLCAILCAIGLHKWQVRIRSMAGPRRRCAHCDLEQCLKTSIGLSTWIDIEPTTRRP